jgi:hypothetical protein
MGTISGLNIDAISVVCSYRWGVRLLRFFTAMTTLLLVAGLSVCAQVNNDTTSIYHIFLKGQIHGQLRNVLMFTDNAGSLTDYRTDAIGGNISYQTNRYKGFSLETGIHFTSRVFSTDLTKADPVTGAANRYESTLYDITAPGKRNLLMLSLLNVGYQFKSWKISLGRQLLNTPFVNMQDNRMQPTIVEGVYSNFGLHTWKIEGGWIYGISPRGTYKWYSVAHSIGLYPQGSNIDGSKGNYKDHVHSSGIGLLAVHWQPFHGLHFQAWDQYSENLFNTFFMQGDFVGIDKHANKWLAGIQYVHQHAINNGGGNVPDETYFDRRNRVNLFSSRVGWENAGIRILVNYTRILPGGRFMMPREWGTEPFYTFLNRERSEGTGNVHAFSITTRRKILPKQDLMLELGYGYYLLPDVKNFSLNKYGVPSYDHLKIGIDYLGKEKLKGVKVSALYIYKDKKGNDYNNLKYDFNKIDVSHFALVVSYAF